MISETLGSLLHQCSKTGAFRHGLSLHAAVLKTGLLSDVIISNHILNMYAKCGKINSARQMFDKMSERNLVTWSAMISGYDQAGNPLAAVHLFSQMQLLKSNEYVYASVISSCATLLAQRLGKQVHAQSVKFGYSTISFVSNSLVSMYMKCGQPGDALSVFSDTDEPNSVAYNAIITGLVENQQVEKGFEVFRLMGRQGLIPNRFTFVGLLGCCSTSEDLTRGMELHCQTIKLKLDSSAFIGNVIITMYSKFNLLEDAMKVFRLIEEKDVISWNTFIASCCHCLDHAKGLTVFREMLKSNVNPDDFTYTSALAVCSGIASVPHGRQIHAHLIRTVRNDDVGVGNALVNMYAKCGCIGHALSAFNLMGFHNLVSWNTIIAGFANHGLGRTALDLFEQMKELGINPDSVTFIALLVACNHAGLVDEGESYFKCMDKIYRISPDIEHISCIVDLLGRAGRLQEAEEYMEKFSFGHDPVVLGCLLSACRLHGDVVIGERMARRLLEVQPATTSPYVLLSNLYASDRMWDGVAEARRMLKGSGLKKEPGHSLIEVKGIVEKFTVRSFSHSRIKEIVDVLKTLSWAEDEASLCY